MGSQSDFKTMKKSEKILKNMAIPFETKIVENEISLVADLIEISGHLIVHRHSSSVSIKLPKFYEIRKEKNYGQSNILILNKI